MYNRLLVLFTLCIASIDTILGTGCNQCVVDGRKIEGNSHFTHHKGCIEYTYCICNCNGGWECFGQHAIDHCRQNVSTGCYYCDVKGQRYNGHSYFKYRDGCYEYNCFCGCDGGWNCPSEKTVDVCNTNTNTGCMYCDVKGQRYHGHSYFKYRDGCYEYNCFCGCDGGWNCPSEKTVDVCNTNTKTGCMYCDVKGQRYHGHSYFKYRDGCYEYNCFCGCDGGWNCPSEKTVDVCNTNTKTGCMYCDVKGQRYNGHSYFKYRDGCYVYNCLCKCDGGWNCPSEKTVDVCNTNTNTGCRYCNVDGQKKQGNSRFDLVRDCYLYSGCICQCDGGWTCAHTTGKYVCGTKRGKARYSSKKVTSVKKIGSSQK